MSTTKRRAIGITRVSVEGDREEDRLYSYATQADAIAESCQRQGIELLRVGKERAVSGGADLSNRPELLAALEAIERGEADVIVAAYFDRFFRSLAVQAQVIERVERAGGELLALDHGRLTNGTAAERLQANVFGAVAQFYREQAAEKSRAGQAAAVARGAVPWSRVPLGYTRRDDGTLEPNPDEVPLVVECFRRRVKGDSYMTIRGWLREHGIERTPRGVEQLLGSRVYLGEIHFGQLKNLKAHDPIIERDLFERVQRMKAPRGPQPKSDRLLARLKVVRCGSCGSALGTMKLPRQGDYPIYRCGSHNDCDRHVTISAELVESVVVTEVKRLLAGIEGTASADDHVAEAAQALDRAQGDLDAAIRAFAGLETEPAAVERLGQLRQARDEARERHDRLAATQAATSVAVTADDWDRLTLDEQRDLIRAVIERVTVKPGGRGVDRLTIVARVE